MPDLPLPHRLFARLQPHAPSAAADDTLAELLLTAAEPPPGTPAGIRPLTDFLDALRAAPSAAELTGEEPALATFRQVRDGRVVPGVVCHRGREVHHGVWDRSLHWFCSISAPAPARMARSAAIKAGLASLILMSLGGVATAASMGALPAPWQGFAHRYMGVPMPAAAGPGTDTLSDHSEPAATTASGTAAARAAIPGTEGRAARPACGTAAPSADRVTMALTGRPSGLACRPAGPGGTQPGPAGSGARGRSGLPRGGRSGRSRGESGTSPGHSGCRGRLCRGRHDRVPPGRQGRSCSTGPWQPGDGPPPWAGGCGGHGRGHHDS